MSAFSAMVGLERLDQPEAGETTSKGGAVPDRLNADRILFEGEVNLITRDDPQPVTQRLRDHDLALRPNPTSHTREYNLSRRRSTNELMANRPAVARRGRLSHHGNGALSQRLTFTGLPRWRWCRVGP